MCVGCELRETRGEFAIDTRFNLMLLVFLDEINDSSNQPLEYVLVRVRTVPWSRRVDIVGLYNKNYRRNHRSHQNRIPENVRIVNSVSLFRVFLYETCHLLYSFAAWKLRPLGGAYYLLSYIFSRESPASSILGS
jgi:hypothetical protein